MKTFEKETINAQLKDEEKALKDLEKAYKQAKKDCQSKLKALNSRNDMQNLQTIIHQKKYQENLLKQIDGVLNDLQTHTYKSANDFFQGSYQNGYIGSMYELHKQGIPMTIPVSTNKMMTAIQTNSKLSTNYYLKQGLTVQNIRTLKKQIAMEATRGIASGKSWLEVADSLTMQRYFQISQSDAMRIVRTEGNRINQQGRLDAGDEAVKNGCDLLKQWDATLDSKTRPAHQEADGQIVEWNEKFTVGGEKMDAPSVGGSAFNVCNCRCQLLKRPRWALDDEELEILKQRASYYGLDKTKSFQDFKDKFLKLPAGAGELLHGSESVENLNNRLKELEKQKDTKSLELEGLKIEERGGSYQEQKIKDLEDRWGNISKLTDEEVRKLKELHDHMNDYTDKWMELNDELSNIRSKRPRWSQFTSDEAYDKAFEKYLLRKQELQEQIELYAKLANDAMEASTKLNKYEMYKSSLNSIKSKFRMHEDLLNDIKRLTKEIDDIDTEVKSIREKIKKLSPKDFVLTTPLDSSDDQFYDFLFKGLKRRADVDYNPVESNFVKLSDEEIISILAGGDETSGSCASVGLAYVGQKQGWNIRDFRGGSSQGFFSNSMNLSSLSKTAGMKSIKAEGKCSLTVGNRLLKKCEAGKEYYLCVGRHASIVRKTEDGTLQYLELQSRNRSGWTNFADDPRDTLNRRFGCTKTSDGGYSEDFDFMLDLEESDFETDEFRSLLGFINTAEDQQRKGVYGSIK